MLLTVIVMGWRTLRSSISLANNRSMAILRACHRPEDGHMGRSQATKDGGIGHYPLTSGINVEPVEGVFTLVSAD